MTAASLSRSLVCVAAALTLAGVARHAACQPTPPRATLSPFLRLDATAEDFSSVGRVAIGARNQIVVPLPQDWQLRFYDSTGKRLASVGRRGAGPGEFQSINVIGWVAETLWVNDFEQKRIVYIAPDGKVVRTTPYPTVQPPPRQRDGIDTTFVRYYPMAVHRDGSMSGIGWFSLRGGRGNPFPPTSGQAAIRVTADGRPRIIAKPPNGEDPRWYMIIGGFGNPVPFRFQPSTVFSADGERIAHMWSDVTSRDGGTFTVTALRTTGDTSFVRTFPFRSTVIPQRVKDSAAADFLPKRGEPTEGPADLSRRFQAMALQKMPAIYPGVESLLLGLDNTVWVRLRETADGKPHLVLNGRGDPVATVVIPKRSRLLQASATHVWVADTDADGLTSVVGYRVTGIRCDPLACR